MNDRNVANRVLNPARDRAGLEWLTFHTFRHTCASMLLANGKTIRQVAEWLGHGDPSFTLRQYVHLMDDGLGGAEFFDGLGAEGNKRATQRPETAANATPAAAVESAA